MQSERISSYISFMEFFEYPMVLFEKESGTVVQMNYEAQKLLGKQVSKITITQDATHVEEIFEKRLEYSNSILWYRIVLTADDRKYYVSGIVNMFSEEGRDYYALMFESRGDLQRGSVTLEHMINRSGYVAIYLYADGDEWKLRYISQNISQFGYTSEQFYRGMVGIRDMMSPEDFSRVEEEFKEKARSGEDDFSVYTYWNSEAHQKYYVRMDMHFDRDQYGKLIGLDFLVHDLSKEQKESEENQYLRTAIHKSRSVVVVKRYEGGKRYLKLITPNASTLGFNVEALQQGSRLTEDYIHPEDREQVLDLVYRTIAAGESGRVHTYRLLGDDGVCRYVKSEITITHLSDTEADVEFLITDITEEKEYEQEIKRQQKSHEQEIDFIMKGYQKKEDTFDAGAVLKDEFMEELIEAFVNVTGLYSVIVDLDGRFITKPVGAVDHIGEFYDMFERPFYKELYLKFNDMVLKQKEPVVMEMNDGNPNSRISGAPIMMDDRHVGTWIICAYSKKERARLMEVYRAQYAMSERVSNYLYNEAVVDKEIKRSRLNEYRLEQELKRQEIITELLSTLRESNIHSLGTILERAGSYLQAERMSFYRLDSNSHTFNRQHTWIAKNIEPDSEQPITWRKKRNSELENQLRREDYAILNIQQCSQDIRSVMQEHGVKVCLAVPVFESGKLTGMLMCCECRGYRMWKDSEIQFARNIRDIIQTVMGSMGRGADYKAVGDSLIAAYHHLPEIIFVRDALSGEIYFSNKAADKAFGMDLRGYDSNQIVKSMFSQYGKNPAMRKHFVYNKNVMKWESYIRQLDKVMHVEEVSIAWYDEKDAKLVILTD